MTIISCMFPEIWSARYIIYNHFGPFFALLPPPPSSLPPNNPKSWNFENNEKKTHFETPKIMIIYYLVPEIRRVTNVICIFIFGLFFAVLTTPAPSPTNLKLKILKKWRNHLKISSFYTCAPNRGIVEVSCATDRRTDGRTDGKSDI